MEQIQIDNKLLVKLPEEVVRIRVSNFANNNAREYYGEPIPFYTNVYGYFNGTERILCNTIDRGFHVKCPYKWEIVGETKSITEEQAGYLLLRFPAKLKFNPFMTAVQNLHRWMEANKVPLEGNYLILIKK